MILLSLALLSLNSATAETVSPGDLAAKLVAAKAGMPNRYHLQFHVEGRMPEAPTPHGKEWNATFHLWRDGNKLRVDQFDAQYTPRRAGHDPLSRRISCQNCEREGYGIMTTVLPGMPLAQHMVEFHRDGTFPTEIYCTAFDWRFLGLSNADVCQYTNQHIGANFTKFFGLPGVKAGTRNRGAIGCVVASRNVPLNNTEWSVWLSEQDEFNPVFFEEKFDVNGISEIRSTNIEWQRTSTGRMFPKRVQHTAIVSVGSTKTPSDQVLTLSHVDFDSPIDPAVFTVAGFGLNEKQIIAYPELKPEEQPRWKNGKVDYSETAAKQAASGNAAVPQAVAPYPVESNLSSIIGICAAVMAVVTAVTALVLRRRRNAA